MKRTRFLRPKKYKPTTPKHKKNDEITAPEIRLIDDDGNMLGLLSIHEALRRAEEEGVDLIEVAPDANPPVCKLIDYGKYSYQQEKIKKKQKTQKVGELKTIRLSTRIGKHDIDVRIKQAVKFLQKGNKIKIELMLKGRERQHRELSKQVLEDFLKSLEEQQEFKFEQEIKQQGHILSTLIQPKS